MHSLFSSQDLLDLFMTRLLTRLTLERFFLISLIYSWVEQSTRWIFVRALLYCEQIVALCCRK